jgi:hypothetical protein
VRSDSRFLAILHFLLAKVQQKLPSRADGLEATCTAVIQQNLRTGIGHENIESDESAHYGFGTTLPHFFYQHLPLPRNLQCGQKESRNCNGMASVMRIAIKPSPGYIHTVMRHI